MNGIECNSILVLYKPQGAARICEPEEARAIRMSWAELLLHVSQPNVDVAARRSSLLDVVLETAARRAQSEQEYDIRAWRTEATPDIIQQDQAPSAEDTPTLIDLLSPMFVHLGLQLRLSYAAWLNRVAIELIYGHAEMFQKHRQILVPALLEAPVVLQLWHGERVCLAHALKLIVRNALSTSPFTNLLHIEYMSPAQLEHVSQSLVLELQQSG